MVNSATYAGIVADIRKKNYKPIYYLAGPEGYFIDRISELIEKTVLTDDERDFNQDIVYGRDSTFEKVIEMSMAYPVMSEHRVVIVKEAQDLGGDIGKLSYYLSNPLKSNVLVFCHKNELPDKRKKIFSEIASKGVYFESVKLKDAALPGFITDYLKDKEFSITGDAASVAAEYIGSDISKIAKEFDKILLFKTAGDKNITVDDVVANIDSVREYNVFELKNALIAKDVMAVFKIVKFLESNPKAVFLPKILPLLFNFFSNLMLAYYAPDKSPRGIASFLDLKSEWQSKDYLNAMRRYTGKKVMDIIGEIKNTDAKSKGVGYRNVSDAELLKELVWFILH